MPDAPTFVDAFKGNPVFIGLSIVLGAAGFAMLIVVLITRRKSPGVATAIAIAAAVAGLLAMGAGFVGSSNGKEMTELVAATPDLTDADRVRIRAHGYAEARIPLVFGIEIGALPLGAGAVLALLGMWRRKK